MRLFDKISYNFPYGLTVSVEAKRKYIAYKGDIYTTSDEYKRTPKETVERLVPYGFLLIVVLTIASGYTDVIFGVNFYLLFENKYLLLMLAILLIPISCLEWLFMSFLSIRLFRRCVKVSIPDLDWSKEAKETLKNGFIFASMYAVAVLGFYLYFSIDEPLLYILSFVMALCLGVVSPFQIIATYRFQTKQRKNQQAQISITNKEDI
ncbi:MAG: hypothetical protein IJV62_03770 [Eggerthellaceae bacterium]|nr:hypothetical protein [Eggerthellaceae bacterium]